MSEDVKPEIIKRTQDILGKHIKKPPLTEKLLKKPPFRFLHDIITAVIRGTGFLDGILTTVEMNHQNIKDKESKIAFLQKVIDAVKSSTGIPLTVRPNKIVAGHEPTKTNEFLQAIGKGIDAQKNGKIPSTHSQQAKAGNQQTPKNLASNLTTKPSLSTDNAAVSTKQTKSIHKNLSQVKTKDTVKKKVPGSITSTKSTANSKVSTTPSKTKNEADSIPTQSFVQPVVSDSLESTIDVESNPHEEPEMLEQVDESRGVSITEDTEVPPVQGVEMTRPSSAHLRQRNLTVTKHLDTTNGAESIITQPSHINKRDDVPRPEHVGDDTIVQGEIVSLRRPMSARAPSARPASARPAAPRIRDRGEVPRAEEARPVSRMVNVITENDTNNDKFVDEFLIKAKPVDREDELALASTSQSAEEGNHGHLVDQILETQKDLGYSAVSSTPKKESLSKKTDIEWEGGRKRDRETVKQEVAKLRELIQNAARIVNPAGKRMEFVQEDVDTMNRDLETWAETNKQLALQLQEEQRLTEQAVEPMKMQQIQLEEMIQEKRVQISLLKANILLNDKRIKNLLSEEGNHH